MPVRRLLSYWKIIPIFVIGLIGSGWLFYSELKSIETSERRRLEDEGRAALELIRLEIKSSEQYLFSLKGFFATRKHVSKADFHDYIAASGVLQRLNYLDNFNYAVIIATDKQACLIREVRSDRSMGESVGQESFTIKDPPSPDFLHPIIYVEPWSIKEGNSYGYGKALIIPAASQEHGSDRLTHASFINPDKKDVLYLGIRLFATFTQPKSFRCGQANEYGSFGVAIDMPTLIGKHVNSNRLGVTLIGRAPGRKASPKPIVLYTSLKRPLSPCNICFVEDVQLAGLKYQFVFERRDAISAIRYFQPWLLLGVGILATALATAITVTLISFGQLNREKALLAKKEAEEYKDHLARLDRLNLLSSLTAGITHEIQQPLASARLWLESIYLEIGQGQNANASRPVVIQNQIVQIERELDRAIDIVKRLREVAARKPELPKTTQVNVSEVIDQCVATMSHSFQLAHVDLRFSEPEYAIMTRVDRVLLMQTVLNIMNNALDACRGLSGKQVTISLTKVDNSTFAIGIEDNGLGVQVEPIEKIFLPLFTTKSSGSGIGLFICKLFIEHNGGKLAVENLATGGARFVITLPVDVY